MKGRGNSGFFCYRRSANVESHFLLNMGLGLKSEQCRQK